MTVPHRRHLLALSLLALACVAAPAVAGESVDLLIRHAAVIDVRSGKTRPDQAIAIKGARILAIVDDAKARRFDAARSLDARGKYAIPALWDMHVHFGGGDKLCCIATFEGGKREVADLEFRCGQGSNCLCFTQTRHKEAFAVVNLWEHMKETLRGGRLLC